MGSGPPRACRVPGLAPYEWEESWARPSQADHSSLFILCKVCTYRSVCLRLSVCLYPDGGWEGRFLDPQPVWFHLTAPEWVPSCPSIGQAMQRNEMDLSLASLGRRLPSFLPRTPSSPVQTTSTPVLRPGDRPVHLQTGSCHPTSLHTDQASVSIWKSHRLQDRGVTPSCIVRRHQVLGPV